MPNIVIDENSRYAPALGGPYKGIETLKPGVVKSPGGIKARLIASANVPNADKHTVKGGKSRRSRRTRNGVQLVVVRPRKTE
jgi:hypothetical protein